MKIQIVDIDKSSTVPLRDGKARGFPGHFRSATVSGSATFVPYSSRLENLRSGNSISVEIEQESVSDFTVSPDPLTEGIVALSVPGDYLVTGVVENRTGDEVFDIRAHDCRFALDLEETGGIVCETGQFVSFKLHGLSLWDTNC